MAVLIDRIDKNYTDKIVKLDKLIKMDISGKTQDSMDVSYLCELTY